MKKLNHSSNLLSEKEREKAIKNIIDFFETERDQKIGVIAAEEILEMFLDTNGKLLYNKGLDDAKDYIKERSEEIVVDVEALLRK